MENRWGSRKPSGIDVILDYRPLGLVHGTLRNYSLSGAYIQTVNASIPVNASINLVFLMPDDLVTQIQRVRAQVVRQDGTGLGIMFTDIERHTLRILHSMQKKTRSDHAVHTDPGQVPTLSSDPMPAIKTTSGSSS